MSAPVDLSSAERAVICEALAVYSFFLGDSMVRRVEGGESAELVVLEHREQLRIIGDVRGRIG